MSFQYGPSSNAKLDTVHPHLRMIAIRALQRSPYDITIVHGWRGEEIQNALFDSHASTKRFPDSRHNKSQDPGLPDPLKVSDAIDFAPWIDGGIPWNETHIFAAIAGLMFAAADELGLKIRWGGDWDTDGNTREHKLQDWGHIEIIHE